MRISSFVLAAFMALASASAGLAATIEVRNVSYEISFVEGSVDTDFLQGQVTTSQVWWGDRELAFEFANALKDSLGYVNSPNVFPNNSTGSVVFINGPTFLYESDYAPYPNSTVTGAVWTDPTRISQYTIPTGVVDTTLFAYDTAVYATATVVSPVPIPAGGLLLVTTLGGFVALRRSRTQSA